MKTGDNFFKIQESNSEQLMTKFKEEVLVDAKEIEKIILESHNNLRKEFDKRVLNYEKSLEDISLKYIELNNFVVVDRTKLDKINELCLFQKKASDQLISHELKLNSLQKDLNASQFKYDKIFLDNLIVPGTIGDYCKFKNMREYIENNTNQIQSLTNFREKHSLDLKSYKEKLDTMIKSINIQLDNNDKNGKLYANKLIAEYELKLKSDISDLNSKLGDIRMENNKYSLQLQKVSGDLSVEYSKLLQMKAEVNEQLDKSVLEMKDMHKETENKFSKVDSDFDVMKYKFGEIAEFIKVI